MTEIRYYKQLGPADIGIEDDKKWLQVMLEDAKTTFGCVTQVYKQKSNKLQANCYNQ